MNTSSNQKTSKQIAAIICVILIGVMILATLLTAFLDSTGVWFRACLVLTIAVPILSWIYIWIYGVLEKKHTIASFDLPSDGSSITEEQSEE